MQGLQSFRMTTCSHYPWRMVLSGRAWCAFFGTSVEGAKDRRCSVYRSPSSSFATCLWRFQYCISFVSFHFSQRAFSQHLVQSYSLHLAYQRRRCGRQATCSWRSVSNLDSQCQLMTIGVYLMGAGMEAFGTGENDNSIVYTIPDSHSKALCSFDYSSFGISNGRSSAYILYSFSSCLWECLGLKCQALSI